MLRIFVVQRIHHLLVTAAIGQANIVTHVNLEGSGNTMSLVVGRANIITRVSSLEDYTVTISPLDCLDGLT
jgi:hypothetical protein